MMISTTCLLISALTGYPVGLVQAVGGTVFAIVTAAGA